MKKAFYALTLLGLAACGDKTGADSANRLAGNDFESVEGWVNDPGLLASLTTDKAHSGKYSIKVDQNVEYSAGYNNVLGKLTSSKVKTLKVHAWVYVTNPNSAVVLVTAITNPTTNKQLLWEGMPMKEAKGTNKWVEIEKTINVPAEASYADRLSVYMWRASAGEAVYLDDLTIDKGE